MQAKRLAHMFVVATMIVALISLMAPVTLAAPPAQAGDSDPNGIVCYDNALGDRVWHDMDGDGCQDEDEPGVDGVTVRLYRSGSNSSISTKTTSGGGYYRFEDLDPSKSYYVRFVKPSGYEFTIQDAGCGDTLDSDADPTTGKTISVSVPKNFKDLTWDAGLYQPASLGDRVWLDANRNGIQDIGEVGVEGVTVHLYRSGGVVPEATTVTDANGEYLFTDLAPGDYFVEFVLPAGYAFTAVDQGGDLAADSDADPSTGQTAVTTLVSGEEDLTWDAGLVGALSLGNLVWNDQDNDSVVDPTDGNGVQDPGEPAFAGVAVWLFSGPCAGVNIVVDPHLSGTTDANGVYLFTNLTPGRYCVVIPPSAFQTGGPLAGYDVTQLDAGGDDALDSDAEKSLYPAPEYAYIDAVLTDHDDDTFDFGFVIGNPPTAVTLTALAADSATPRPWSAVAWGALGIVGMIGLAWRRWGR